MIALKLQIYTIIFSFLYGIGFSTILIVILSILIYFIGIMKISYGIFHIYSILCIIIGYILTSLVVSYIAKRKRK